jgi:hypothetical protein
MYDTACGLLRQQRLLTSFPRWCFSHFVSNIPSKPGFDDIQVEGATMKNLAISLALGILLLASVSLAQDTTSSGKSKSKDRTITGCLQTNGSGPDKFVLMGNDGSTWDLKSDSVVLADHVGHTITARGTVSNVTMHNAKEQAKDEAAAAGMKKTNDEHGDLEVATLRVVSKSCK